MARPLRVNRPGLWHHVTNRGNARQKVFLAERDRRHFLDLVGELSARYQVRVHAYVLMDNHYHLLVETTKANLSRAMQWLNTSYGMWFNRAHERIGHVFGGRFKSVAVEGGAWAVRLSEYIHLNPVRIEGLGWDKAVRAGERGGGATAPTEAVVEARLRVVRQYRWSSYRAYAGYERGPAWLEQQRVLGRGGGELARARREYRRRVEDYLRQGQAISLWEQLRAGVLLGSQAFVEQMREGLRLGREAAGKRAWRAKASFADVVGWVQRERGMEQGRFWRRRGDWGRPLALWAARMHGGMMLKELGEQAHMDYGAVAMAVRRFAAKARRDKKLAALQAKLVEEVFGGKPGNVQC